MVAVRSLVEASDIKIAASLVHAKLLKAERVDIFAQRSIEREAAASLLAKDRTSWEGMQRAVGAWGDAIFNAKVIENFVDLSAHQANTLGNSISAQLPNGSKENVSFSPSPSSSQSAQKCSPLFHSSPFAVEVEALFGMMLKVEATDLFFDNVELEDFKASTSVANSEPCARIDPQQLFVASKPVDASQMVPGRGVRLKSVHGSVDVSTDGKFVCIIKQSIFVHA